MSLNITSGAFDHGAAIPRKYTCDGDNVSPPLAWSNVPGAAKELALILDDPDAPSGVFVHWVVYGLPATAAGLDQNTPATEKLQTGGVQGRNGFGNPGYGGPCPQAENIVTFFIYTLWIPSLGLRRDKAGRRWMRR